MPFRITGSNHICYTHYESYEMIKTNQIQYAKMRLDDAITQMDIFMDNLDEITKTDFGNETLNTLLKNRVSVIKNELDNYSEVINSIKRDITTKSTLVYNMQKSSNSAYDAAKGIYF